MSPISFLQRHPRAGLSAYLDGELAPAAALRLEAHIASCAVCAAQLEELREARSALRSIPEAETPRSFALTPAMARDARPVRQALPARRLQPLVNGLRLASAGLAVALAVVVVIGVSGGGSGDDDSSSGTNLAIVQEDGTEQSRAGAPTDSMSIAQNDGSGDDAAATSTPAPLPGATYLDVLVPGSTPGSAGNFDGAGDVPPDAGGGGSVPTNAAAPTPLASGGTSQNLDRDIGASPTDIPKIAMSGQFDSATPVPEAAGPAYDAAADDDGLGTLTIIGLVLGVLLAAALIGSIAASRLARKTP